MRAGFVDEIAEVEQGGSGSQVLNEPLRKKNTFNMCVAMTDEHYNQTKYLNSTNQGLFCCAFVISLCCRFYRSYVHTAVMDWRPVQGVPRLSPEDCWDRLQPSRDPTDGLSGRKWMDGCSHRTHCIPCIWTSEVKASVYLHKYASDFTCEGNHKLASKEKFYLADAVTHSLHN